MYLAKLAQYTHYLININLCKKTSDCECQLPMKTHHNKRSLFLDPSESGVLPPVSCSLVAVAGAEQPSPVWSLSPPAEAVTETSHIASFILQGRLYTHVYIV